MEKIVWKRVKPLKDAEAVKAFLEQKEIVLPEALLEYMTRNNGGRPSVCEFATEKREGYVFQCLLSWNADDSVNVYDVFTHLFEGGSLFPIGLESAGNVVCYDLVKKEYVLWSHEDGTCEKIIAPMQGK